MRIVHFIPYFQPDLGYQEYHLAKFQKAAGHEVLVVTSEWKLAPSPSGREGLAATRVGTGRFSESDIDVLRLPAWFSVRPICPVKGVHRALSAFRPDAVHCHGLFYNWNAPSLASASRSLACKLLVDEHGSRQNTNLTSRPDKWLHYQLVFRRVIWPKVNRPDTTFVAIGLEERDLLCAATGMDPARVHVIWLGADLTAFKFDETGRRRVRQSLGLSEASVVVLHAGKLSPRKDPEVLLRAWQKVVAQAPDARLLMLAGGEAGYVDSVKRLAGELCISGSVTWHGLAPHDELPDYLSAADIGVWPGDYSNVIQEALACRVPVVLASPETGGHSVNRVLLSAGNGLGFPRGDHEALARCLLEMITSPSRRQEMSSRGEALARSKFDWAAISQQFVELYQGQSTV